MLPVPRPHLFAAVARRAELRAASLRALDAIMAHDCSDCAYGHPCAESRRLQREFHAAREAEDVGK